MNISALVEKLNGIKSAYGDLEVCIDLANIKDNSDHGEYSYEPMINIDVDEVEFLDMDGNKFLPKEKAVLLRIEE